MQFETAIRNTALAHANVDFEKMYAIAKHLHENPAEKAVFAEAPEAYAFRFNGYRVQDGGHLHVSDENNNLIPAEEYGVFGSEDSIKWGRSEVRVGYKTTALVECM